MPPTNAPKNCEVEYNPISLTYLTFSILLTLFFIAFNAMEAMLPSLISKIATDDKRG
jgi:hypothetical protein